MFNVRTTIKLLRLFAVVGNFTITSEKLSLINPTFCANLKYLKLQLAYQLVRFQFKHLEISKIDIAKF